MSPVTFNPLIPIEEGWLILAVILGVGLWPIWRSTARLTTPWRIAAFGLRMAGLLALCMLALNPGRWAKETRGLQREWAVLADRSQSMDTADADGGGTRWEAAMRTVGDIEKAARHPEHIRYFSFAAELEGATDADLVRQRRPDGDRTRLEEAIGGLLTRYRAGDRTLAGILVLGDGRRVEPEPSMDAALAARAQDTPIFAIPFGGPVETPDLSVVVARRQAIAFADQPVRIAARVLNRGLGPVRVTIALEDAQGKTLSEQKIDLADNSEQTLNFDIASAEPGYAEYTVIAPVLDGESIVHNNRASFGVSTLPGRMRTLLVEGAPYWDSKFLAQRLRRQPNIDVTAVYRLSAERHFIVLDDATTPDEARLETVFPVDAEALAQYDVLLFGKGLDAVLSPARIESLKRYVRDHGGRIVFFRGKPYHDRFEALEGLEPLEWGEPIQGEVAFQPLPYRQTAGLFGDSLPGADDPVWARMPGLRNVSRAVPRAFTEVAAQATGDGNRAVAPLLAWRSYGRGLIAVVNAEGFWRWDFFPETTDAHDMYQEFWTQLLQWAMLRAEFMPGRDIAIIPGAAAARPDEPVRVTVRWRAGSPMPGADPVLTVWRGSDRIRDLVLARTTNDERLRETMVALPEPGLYRLSMTTDAMSESGTAEALLRIDAPPLETDRVGADPLRLARLAEASGGRILTPAEAGDWLRGMETDSRADADADGKSVWIPIWDRAAALALILACFVGDIFVRRRRGLL